MTTFDAGNLVASLELADTWIVLGVAAGAGAVGGLLQGVGSKVRSWMRPLYGAAAAVVVMLLAAPPDAVRLVATALLAGYGGKALLDAIQLRMQLTLAQEAAKQAKQLGEDAVAVAREVTRGPDLVAGGPFGSPGGNQPAPPALARLDEIARRLEKLPH